MFAQHMKFPIMFWTKLSCLCVGQSCTCLIQDKYFRIECVYVCMCVCVGGGSGREEMLKSTILYICLYRK